MDNNGNIYISDFEKHEVRRWNIEETNETIIASENGTIVAGGNGRGDQINEPTFVFVNEDHSVYVSDNGNNRVMKWLKDAKEVIIIAGGQGEGNSLTQLDHPNGLIIDHLGNIYVRGGTLHLLYYRYFYILDLETFYLLFCFVKNSLTSG